MLAMVRPEYSRVKAEVAAIHERFGVSDPPVDPVRLAREMGIGVHFVKFSGEHTQIAGFYDFEDNAIYVNADEWPLRQTFTVAHELGHAILHREWARSGEYTVLLRNGAYSGEDAHEKEANAFAAHLLVPRSMLNRYWTNLSIGELSRLFAVSVPMIENRLKFEYGI